MKTVHFCLLVYVLVFTISIATSSKSQIEWLQELAAKLKDENVNSIDTETLARIALMLQGYKKQSRVQFPIVVNTWGFVNATAVAWESLSKHDDPVQAVVDGCSRCEELRCDGTVGYGGSPDETSETTLDALIMDGKTHDAGSVAGMKRIKAASAVAKAVMTFTKHTLLVGDSATQFAVDMGFEQEDLHAKESVQKWTDWFGNQCQPNFWQNVLPEATEHCGPYKPKAEIQVTKRYNGNVSARSHDTIGMIAISSQGHIAGGTSTNGASHKIPGRVGDSPLIGSGAYVDNDVGGAVGTGDGDTLMKFVPAYQAVESMRNGMSPSDAAADAIQRIVKHYENFVGAILAIDKNGNHGAACHGIESFPYSVKDSTMNEVTKMIHSLIEAYPEVNYVLAVLAVVQFIFVLHVGLDLLDKQNEQEKQQGNDFDTTNKLKTQ